MQSMNGSDICTHICYHNKLCGWVVGCSRSRVNFHQEIGNMTSFKHATSDMHKSPLEENKRSRWRTRKHHYLACSTGE